MRSTRRFAALSLLILGACSSAQPPPPDAPPQAKPQQVAAPRPIDLSPVPAPAGHFATLRIKSVKPALEFAGQKATGNAKEGMLKGLAEAAREVLGQAAKPDALATVIAVDAPVHAIAAIAGDASAPDAHVAVSVGLTSLDGAKAAIQDAREIGPGQWAVRDGDVPCLIAASGGSTPARLICGKDEASVVSLAPYLARTLAAEPIPADDFALEVRVGPLDERFGRDVRRLLPQATILARSELAIGEPTFDRAIERAAGGLANELGAWMSDLDTFKVVGKLNPDGSLTADVGFSFRQQTSWLANTTKDMAGRKAPPPAMFWQLPKDAHGASWSSSYDGSRWNDMVLVLRDLLSGGLAKFSIGTPDDRKAITALLAIPPGVRPATVSANGKAPSQGPEPKTAQAKIDRALRDTVGWYVFGFAEPADSSVKWLKDLAAAYSRPSVQSSIKKHLDKDDAKLIPTLRSIPAPKPLGNGAYALELAISRFDLPPALGKGTGKASIFILVMPDGASGHFIGFGPDKDEVTRRLVASKSGAPGDGTLATRAGLDGLRSQTSTSGGFLSIESVASSVTNDVDKLFGGRTDPDKERFVKALKNLPNKGQTPVIFRGSAEAQPLSMTARLTAPKPTLEDVEALIDELVKAKR